MSGRIIIGRGRAAITITGPTASELEAAVRELMGPAIAEMEREVLLVRAEHIDPDWPVVSGRSRDSWEMVTRLLPEKLAVEVILTTRLVYVRYLRSTRVGRAGDATRVRSPIHTEVNKPMRKARRRFKSAIVDILNPILLRAIQNA